ncbi:MAG: hypothetical protein ACRDIY_11410 [Chloroflexota bacterium]
MARNYIGGTMWIKQAGWLVFVLSVLLAPAAALAAPASQENPAVTISPTTARPGQSVQVTVSGFTAPNHRNAILCVGLLGPGRNVELGRSPAFRPRVGQVVVGANGAGQTSVAVPADFVSGSYQLVVGGCARQPDLAPLAALASATLSVEAATPASLPATGGAPLGVLAGLLAVGVASLVGGIVARRNLHDGRLKS